MNIKIIFKIFNHSNKDGKLKYLLFSRLIETFLFFLFGSVSTFFICMFYAFLTVFSKVVLINFFSSSSRSFITS